MLKQTAWWRNFRRDPDRADSLARYARLAPRYESTTVRIRDVRAHLVDMLQLQPGETVLDVACGAGALLPVLADRVGPSGRVIGIEQSPPMAAHAAQAAAGRPNVEVCAVAIEDFEPVGRADAAVLSYTHDVLQNPHAVARLLESLRPGARIAVAGLCMAPWSYGVVQNLWVLWGARNYLTTWRGLHAPWTTLHELGAEVTVLERYHGGTGYIALARRPVDREPATR